MTFPRNPVLGGIAALLIVIATTLSFFLDALPVVGAGPKYTARFTEAAGLKPAAEVRVAGVKVGKVTDVRLEDATVIVDFRVKDVWLGDTTEAHINIKTLLGRKYMELIPSGQGELQPGDTIPLERTTAPYDVVDAFAQASQTLDTIDSQALAESLDIVSTSLNTDPTQFSSALSGISRLSETISSRDAQLAELFQAVKQTSGLLAENNEDFLQLMASLTDLSAELNYRRESIQLVLAAVADMSTQIQGLINDNQQQFGPTLDNLSQLLTLLTEHDTDLRTSIVNLEAFYRLYANIVGSGRWFDAVVVNLLPITAGEIPSSRAPIANPPGNAPPPLPFNLGSLGLAGGPR